MLLVCFPSLGLGFGQYFSVNVYLHLHLNSSAHTPTFFCLFVYFMYHQSLIDVRFTPSDSRLVLFFDAHTFLIVYSTSKGGIYYIL